MVKVAGDTSTCPPPESVTMEQTVTEGSSKGSVQRKKDHQWKRVKKENENNNNNNNTRQSNQVQSHASVAEGEKRKLF